MKKNRIVALIFVFISLFVYGISSNIDESIKSISSRKPSELNLTVTKLNSKPEKMYIDRVGKKIFYFFGNEGLIKGDFLNVTEKPSEQGYVSKTFSRLSGNTNELRYSNRGESKNLKYTAEKGLVKNRVVATYKNEPKALYIEFYDGLKKLKKIIKNEYEEVVVKDILVDLDLVKKELILEFDKNNNILEDLNNAKEKDKIEIFTFENSGKTENLSFVVEEAKNLAKGSLKIPLPSRVDNIYLVHYDNKNELKSIYSLKIEKPTPRNYITKSSYFTWNQPEIDITKWNRKDIKTLRNRSNTDIIYGTETLPDGVILPYIDIKMGSLLIPDEITATTAAIGNTNHMDSRGQVILTNEKNQNISGRLYLKSGSSALRTPVKGKNYQDIVNSTSTVTYIAGEGKSADIFLRVYDLPENQESLFSIGKLKYVKSENSTNTVEVLDGSTVVYKEDLPEIEVLDIRDNLKRAIRIDKKNVDMSEEIGINIGDDIKWSRAQRYVDIKIAEIEISGFEDKTSKIKNPYIEISTSDSKSDKNLESSGELYGLQRYFLRDKMGVTEEIKKITQDDETLGYSKVAGKMSGSSLNGFSADIVVRMDKAGYETLKNTVGSTLELKNADNTPATIKVVFNEDYPDQALEIPYNSFKVIKTETERKNNNVKIDAVIFFNDIRENSINLVFDPAKNSSGDISVRGNLDKINSSHKSLIGRSVFDMDRGIISRTYRDTDIIEVENARGISGITTTTAKFSTDDYKSVTFTGGNIDFELKFWNNTDRVELTATKGATAPSDGEIYGEFLLKDAHGEIHNKITLNLYSSTVNPTMNTDSLRIWRNYTVSPVWGTEVEIVNTTTSTGTVPNEINEGGLTAPVTPFKSFSGDTVYLEPMKGAGKEGIDGKSVSFSQFKYKDNFGTISGNRLQFDSTGKGNAKVALTLTKDFIESYFPNGKPYMTFRFFEVAEIVYGKGKRRAPVSMRLQLRHNGTGTANYPVKVVSNHTQEKYYQAGLYPKTATVTIKDITPGQERDIAEITPTTVSGTGPQIVPNLGGTKSFRGKNIKTDISITVPTTGTLNNAGIYLSDVILTNTSGLFGIFTMIGGSEQAKEHEIWIPKYSPIAEIQSLASTLYSNSEGPKYYEEDFEVSRQDVFDADSTVEVVKNLGFIQILGRDKSRADIMRRNSLSLNFAKLPDRIKLTPVNGSGVQIDGFLSFAENSLVTEIEQREGVDQGLGVYLIISAENAKKVISGTKYILTGEYSAGRISENQITTDNLLYYGLKTDNLSDLGLNEYIYEPIFKMDLNASIAQSSSVLLNLDNASNKPLLKSENLSKNIRVYQSRGRYSSDVKDSLNYMMIDVSGKLSPYDYSRVEFKNQDHILRVTDKKNGRIFTGTITPKGGKVDVETDLLDMTLQYSDSLEVREGFNGAHSLEVLNIGLNGYKNLKGEVRLLLEHLDPADNSRVLISDEILIKVPDFSPRSWYYDEFTSKPVTENIVGKYRLQKGQDIIFELGEVGLIAGRNKDITIGQDDSIGVRIEYDKNITLEKIDDPTVKIQGTLTLLDSEGNRIPDQAITGEAKILGVTVDRAQPEYDSNAFYVIKDLDVTKSELITNKPIRIGRNGHWEGLVKSITLEPSAQGVFGQFFKWSSPLVDITDWSGKTFKSARKNTNFTTGTEIIAGEEFPYLDINMGEILIPIADPELVGESFQLKTSDDEKTRGKVLLKNRNGTYMEGRLYFKSDLDIEKVPVKGKNNSDIEGSTSKVFFKGLKEKKASVHLRIYDSKKGEPSLFVEGITEYMKNRISDNTIEILSRGKVLYTDTNMPVVEFVDTRDTLKENAFFDKRVLDFTYNTGKNAGEDVQWALANRFVDVRLMGITVDNFDDKVTKLKDPYIEIDSANGLSTSYIEAGNERITPYRYFIRLVTGKGFDEDKITEGDYIMGYKKISTNIEHGKVNNLQGDIIVRLLSEDYAKIKSSGAKSLSFKKNDGISPKVRLILNSDYPDKIAEADLGNYSLLTLDADKIGKTVDLKILLAMREIKETTANWVFDYDKNSTGNIGVRPNGKSINDIIPEISGSTSSVFDMSGEFLSQTYENTDQIVFSGGVDVKDVKDSGAKFEVEGYKAASFTQVSTNIKYEVRFWNNTKKIEIFMDKSGYNGTSRGELSAVIEVQNASGDSKAKLNLILSSSTIDKNATSYVLRYGAAQGSGATAGTGSPILFDEKYIPFEYSAEWNADIIRSTQGNLAEPLDIAIANYKTYTGDTITIGPVDEIQENGLMEENFILRTSTRPYGRVEGRKLVLDNDGNGRAQIEAILTRDQLHNIWRDSNDNHTPKIYAIQITYGNGKRKISQWINLRYLASGGIGDGYINLESDLVDNNQRFRMGTYLITSSVEIPDVRDENETLYLDLPFPSDVGNYPSLATREFKGKNIGVRFVVSGGQNTKTLDMSIDDIVLTKERVDFGIFRMDRPSTGGRERNIHRIISPRYNPVLESYSPVSSLETTLDGKGKLLNQKLEIVRDKLDDSTTTLGVVKALGTVGLLGRDSIRGNIIKRNSTTMNFVKLPDRVSLQRVQEGDNVESLTANLSFSSSEIEKDFEQIESVDQEKTIYLHIEKSEAEKLIPGVTYFIQGEYNTERVSGRPISGRNIAYIGLKTDKVDDLGLNEYIYDPLFQINIQTEISQDTSVKLYMSEDKPILKSNGSDNLVRIYLSDAKYSTDVDKPENYSSLSMRGLLTPYEYNKPEYGSNHDMVIRLEGSSNNIRVPITSSSGGQGVLKTISGDIYIGYINDTNITTGTVATNPLEVLTLGLKSYSFRSGSFKINIEHIDPVTGKDILASESFSVEIPKFMPKKWYYNISDAEKIDTNVKTSIKYIDGDNILYPLGNVSIYPDRDTEITKGTDDPLGVRIEYDSEINFSSQEDSGSTIKGRLVRIDSSGNILPQEDIYTVPSQLGIIIDTSQSGYKFNSTYVYSNGIVNEVSGSKDNKPIRIGRGAHWEGIIEKIELDPFVSSKWKSPIIDITNWKRKTFNFSRQNKDFVYGEELFLGETIPYIDINMGEIDAGDNSVVEGVRLKSQDGGIHLTNRKGNRLEGKIYLKSDNTTTMNPIKDKSNNPIPNSTRSVTFNGGVQKKASVHLRIYDSKIGEPSLLVEGITEYMKNRISDNTIEILSGGKVLYTDTNMPVVEFVDTRDTLKENAFFDKRVLDFTYNTGKNAGEDVQWALANRFVDVRLMGITIDNFDDKVTKLKDPYIEIDSANGLSTSYIEAGNERINPYRYFIRINKGKGVEEDKITEGDYIIGYKKISTNIENSKVNDLKADIVVRLLSEDYEKIKNSGAKNLNFKRNSGVSEKVRLVLNSDYPDRVAEVNLGEYSLLTLDTDKLGKIVDLKVLLAMLEIKETTANFVFNYEKNSTGNIEIRPNGKEISDTLGELRGSTSSVFDMSGEFISQTYENTDQISFSSGVDVKDVRDSGAKFEVEGYKAISFTQTSTNIKYELRFWNNTGKVEIHMDKSAYNGTTRGTLSGVIEIRDISGATKAKLNLTLVSSTMNKADNQILTRYGTSQGSGATAGLNSQLLFDEKYSPFKYSPEWNSDVIETTQGSLPQPLDIAIANYVTYPGDVITIEPIDEIQENGLMRENFTLKQSTTVQYGRVDGGKLILDGSGNGRAQVTAKFTRTQMNNIWKDKDDNPLPRIYAIQITYGNGKRKIPQFIQMSYKIKGGVNDAYQNRESDIVDNNQTFRLGTYLHTAPDEIPDVRDENEMLYLDLPFPSDIGSYPSLATREFKGKDIGVAFRVDGSQNTKILSMTIDDIVLTKDREIFGTFRMDRPSTGARERIIHKIISPRYSPVEEAYSPLSSLETSTDGSGKLINQKLEIVRDKLDDPTTTLGIVKSLGTVGLLGRDSIRGNIIKRNSTTMNFIKLPDRVVLQKSKNGNSKSHIIAKLSFDPIATEKDFEQIETVDQEKTIYLHIEKSEAEKLEPGVSYSIQTEYDATRIGEESYAGRNIAYIGLKTDKVDDLGLNEYIYDPLFQINIQTEIAQDTSVKLFMSEDKPILKSNGSNNLARVYLSEATYSADIDKPENYSSLSMRGLLTPYEYNKPEYGMTHNMVITEKISGNKITVPVSKSSGGQGSINTISGKIKIGYINNPNIQSGTIATHPLEVLTIGIEEYSFKSGNLDIEIEHMDPGTGISVLTKESFSLEIPGFAPKKWYYNQEDSLKMEEMATGSVRYLDGSNIIYPLGNVGLYPDRDTEVTKGADDPLGVRIEYDENITLSSKTNSANKIQGRIVRIDATGNILPKEDIYKTPSRLAIVIDTTQAGYGYSNSYVYENGNLDEISSTKANKIIRIGREGYWQGLIKSIELKGLSQGEITLNYDFNYKRATQMDFDATGRLLSGTGAYVSIKGDFIKNVPDTGKVIIHKWVSDDNLYGEKLGEVNIVSGKLEKPLEISYKNGAQTSYSMIFNKIVDDSLSVTLNYWEQGVLNDKLMIRVEDKNGLTSLYKFSLRDFDNSSVLTIEFDNSQMGAGVLPPDLSNSLFFGTILNPNSFDYRDQRAEIESLNRLKITYYGKNLNLHDTIGRVSLEDKDLILESEIGEKVTVEDISAHRIYKRELVNPKGETFYEEGFKLKGYFNPKTNKDSVDGRYRGTLRINVELY